MNNEFHNPNPHFFQPLIPGFHSNFSIPKSFHKFLEEEKDGKDTVTLRDKKGRSWDVKVDDKMQFKQGWNKFCLENELQIGDFLVFRLVGSWDFTVFIFDSTCCERQFSHIRGSNSSSQALGIEEQVKEEGQREKVNFKPRGLPYCHLVPREYSIKSSQVYLPKDFANANGLLDKKSDIVLLDTNGRSWPMRIGFNSMGSPYIGLWAPFQRTHQLKTGDSLVLELIQPGIKPVFKIYS